MIEVLTRGCDAVMATVAGTQDLQVIHQDHGVPQVGGMTVFADVGGTDVVERLANGGDAVVATHTAFGGDVLVVEIGR